jgi:hypothetical protein
VPQLSMPDPQAEHIQLGLYQNGSREKRETLGNIQTPPSSQSS